MSLNVPQGYWLLRHRIRSEAGDNLIRIMLIEAELDAYAMTDDGMLYLIPASDWKSARGEAMLVSGYHASEYVRGTFFIWAMPEDAKNIVVKGAKPPMPEDTYMSPFLRMMVEGSVHFRINPARTNPKIEIIREYFREKRMPNGSLLTENQVKMMATFIRPPEAMRGGQRKIEPKG